MRNTLLYVKKFFQFDFASMRRAHGIVGPAFFMAFVFCVVILLLNMMLSIINDTFLASSQSIPHNKDRDAAIFLVNQVKEVLMEFLSLTSTQKGKSPRSCNVCIT